MIRRRPRTYSASPEGFGTGARTAQRERGEGGEVRERRDPGRGGGRDAGPSRGPRQPRGRDTRGGAPRGRDEGGRGGFGGGGREGGYRGGREQRGPRDGYGSREGYGNRDSHGNREGNREGYVNRDSYGNREGGRDYRDRGPRDRGPREYRGGESRGYRGGENRDYRGPREPRGSHGRPFDRGSDQPLSYRGRGESRGQGGQGGQGGPERRYGPQREQRGGWGQGGPRERDRFGGGGRRPMRPQGVNPSRRRELGLPSDEDIEREAYELEMRAKGIAVPEPEVEEEPEIVEAPPRIHDEADDEGDDVEVEERPARGRRGPRGGRTDERRGNGARPLREREREPEVESGRRERTNGRGGRGRRVALPNPREVALQVLHAVETRDAFSDKLLQARFRDVSLSKRDRDLVVQIVKGTLRWRGRIDYILDRFLHQGMESLSPWARNTLRMGAYQILFLDRVPPHAATHESVRLASRYGHAAIAGLVNAVLRRICEEDRETLLRGPEGDDIAALSVRHSHPDWIVARWVERFGVEGTVRIMEADNASRGVTLRVNARRTTREQLQETLRAEGVETQPTPLSALNLVAENDLSPRDLASFQEGRFTVQDEAETLVGLILDAQPGELIVDLCAGPGGKATHIAESTDDAARVLAVEPRWPRVRKIREAVDRLGLERVLPVQADALALSLNAPADRVLVDAPCSGLGVLGKRADARWRKRPEMIEESAELQRQLLDAAAPLTRPGGVLVYSVCSFEPEEAEQIVRWFLETHPEYTLDPLDGVVPSEVVVDHMMRVLPSQFGTDGAFAARFRRSA